ncbi:transmembrane protease serine 9-like isoform X2 [Osmerus eperlanus]|uniref:transmembrane protease serine 9-like isoform X2 n=1 Tax=Osmerus eperlanus TaxID=29151 RepID=UPI002E0E8511
MLANFISMSFCLSVCGQAPLSSKIVGGQDAPVGGWPWQVSLQRSAFHFCGGSLINSQWVLTAAHCFPRSSTPNLQVIMGAKSLEQASPNQVSSSVEQITCHPNYDTTSQNNDMCLLKLSAPVTFTNYILPVCLAAPGSTYNAGIVSWVTGWGTINLRVNLPSPKNLQEVDVPIVGNRQCNCNYGVGSITDNMLCAGLKVGGKDSCQGDSGGPMVSKQGGRWIQSGVVSFGKDCALANFPGVYARVSMYQMWINSIITSSQPGFVTFNSSGTDSDLSVSCLALIDSTTTTSAPSTTTTSAPSTTTTSAPPTTTTSAPPTTTTSAPSITTTSAPSTTFAPSITTTSTPSTTSAPSTTATSTPSVTTTTPTVKISPSTKAPSSTPAKPVVCGSAPLNTHTSGGSSVVSAGTWPWMASIQQNGTHICGGTLVAENFVMSYASCFSSTPNALDWVVVLGRLKQNGTNPFEETLNVTNITMSNLTGSNLAVLQLSIKPTISNYIQPLCVDLGRPTFSTGTQCWAAGWGIGQGGAEQVLQEFQTSVLDCGNVSSTDNICTTFMDLQQGDGGGPLMCLQNGAWFQAAVLTLPILSGRSANTQSDKASILSNPIQVFSRISLFMNFLETTVTTFPSRASISTTTNISNISNSTTSSPTQSNSLNTGSSASLVQSSICFLFISLLHLPLSLTQSW